MLSKKKLAVRNIPSKLKEEVVNQIDHALYLLGDIELISVPLVPLVVGGHVSTSVLIEKLCQIDDIELDWVLLNEVTDKGVGSCQMVCLTQNGASFLLGEKQADQYYLQRFYKPGEEVEAFWVTDEELFDGLGVLPHALSITKKQSTSALGQPLLPPPSKDAEDDESVAKEHYVTRHFRLQARTALSIIGISVVIALLGVITPLGFQTFTDKILPYQAQSSLMVIAILLVVAAMMTALFNYYRDYQESVLFAKYQSGLGKEVFSRLLAMEVPYFDSRNVGELTKLVDQVEEASNFLVKQLLGAVVVAVVAVVAVVMEDHVEEVADQEAKMLW